MLDETMDIHRKGQELDGSPLDYCPKTPVLSSVLIKINNYFFNYKSNMFKLEKLENTDRLKQKISILITF